MITELMRIGNARLKKSFYKSLPPDENICFIGRCSQYCDSRNPICGDGDRLEVRFIAMHSRLIH